MSTISNTITHGITLAASGAYDSPLTITATGYIDDIVAGNAITGPSAQVWTVVNDGRVVATANYSVGIYLANGGSVDNTGTGLIQGNAGGVYIAGAIGTVTNSGTIVDTNASGYGVRLAGGGSVDNTGTGLIQGKYGVIVFGVAGTVTNSGTIKGTNGDGVFALAGVVENTGAGLIQGQVGVTIRGSGTVSNSATITGTNDAIVADGGSIDNSGLIQSNYNAVFISVAAGTVTNSGTVTGGSDGVYLISGGSVGNTGTGLIQGVNGSGADVVAGAATVTNSGTITGYFYGVRLGGGGGIENTGTGLIQGKAGIYIHGGGAVSNSGTITETGTLAPVLAIWEGGSIGNTGLIQGRYGAEIFDGAGTVTNSGTMAGTSGYEVLLLQGGRIDNTGTGVIQDQSGVYIGGLGVAGTVTNAGTILAAGGVGVALENGGSADNTGLIQSGYGVVARHGAGTVTNAGTIISTQNQYGINLQAGGTVINTATGLIRSEYGVYIGGVDPAGGGNTLGNAGTILSTNWIGANLNFGGSVDNTGTGVIQGSLRGVNIFGPGGTVTNAGTIDGVGDTGVQIDSQGTSGVTLVNSGTIIGGNGHAVELDGAHPLLVLEAGYKFVGDVEISGGTTTLELSGAAGSAVSASVDNFLAPGDTFTDILFGPGGNATLDVSNTGGMLGATISGFNDASDIIDLTQIGTDGTISSQTASEVTVTGSLGSETLLLDASNGTAFTTSSDGVSGTELIPCFCPGTLIETPDGPVAVEDLAVGDRVVTVSGHTRPVRWIGHRRIDLTRHRSPKLAQPIRILAGAFADGVPQRDLLLSPDHAVACDGQLIAAKLLVNGATVRREISSRHVTYLHVELDAHDILLAENLPAESYLDTGNRGMFENAAGPLQLHPDLTNDQGRREADSCLPLATDPAQVEPVWRMLAERAEQLGHLPSTQPVTTATPDFALVSSGQRLVPLARTGKRHVFALPRLLGPLHLMSRHAAPSDLTPWVDDPRRLGVLIRRIVLRSGNNIVTVPVDHPKLTQGWWAPECHDGTNPCRWTDGEAVIPEACLGSLSGPVIVEIELASLAAYPVAGGADVAIDIPTFSQGRRVRAALDEGCV